MGLELKLVLIDKPADVADPSSASRTSSRRSRTCTKRSSARSRGIKFGLAFGEASGACLYPLGGTDEALKAVAVAAAQAIGAGHSFVIVLKDAFPLNVLNAVRPARKCAGSTAPPPTRCRSSWPRPSRAAASWCSARRFVPQGVEDAAGVVWRQELLQKFGYKR